MTFSVGDRVYWDTDSRHIRGTVIEVNVEYTNPLINETRNDYVRVKIDECDRVAAWGQNPRDETEVWPTWSYRLQPLR